MSSYRQDLFSAYHAHTSLLDGADEEKLDWFRWYFNTNYRQHLPVDVPLSSLNILEIGCNKGYLLRVLAENGGQRLTGIDLSPGDLDVARTVCPTATLLCADAFEFLKANQGKFSLIIIKAVLEHIPKNEVMPFIKAMSHALEPGGRVIIDVPNMDWLFASHERYMDFTHEVGFTRESMTQVMRGYFDTISVHPIETSNAGGVVRLLLKAATRFIMSLLLRGVQAEWPGNVSWCRALVGVGIKK